MYFNRTQDVSSSEWEIDVQVVPEMEQLSLRDLMLGYRELKRVCEKQISKDDTD